MLATTMHRSCLIGFRMCIAFDSLIECLELGRWSCGVLHGPMNWLCSGGQIKEEQSIQPSLPPAYLISCMDDIICSRNFNVWILIIRWWFLRIKKCILISFWLANTTNWILACTHVIFKCTALIINLQAMYTNHVYILIWNIYFS